MTVPTLVSPGAFLTLHYRIALAAADPAANAVVDTFGGRPATLQLGNGQLAASLEAKLIGLTAGEHVSFELSANEAYGPRNPELVRRISRSLLDAKSDGADSYSPGDLVEFNAPVSGKLRAGASFAGVLKDLNDQYALFDFNHPLAGQAIRFEAEIIGVL